MIPPGRPLAHRVQGPKRPDQKRHPCAAAPPPGTRAGRRSYPRDFPDRRSVRIGLTRRRFAE